MSKKKTRKSLNPMYIPKQRREYVDYDYVSKLSDEEKEFLGKFTDEFYGAGFDISPTFIKIDEETLKGLKDLREREWAESQESEEYIQVNHRDLRKYRSVVKYYKDKEDNYTTDLKYKYSDTNVHKDPQQFKSCNDDSTSRDRDISSRGIRLDSGNSSKLLNELESQIDLDRMSPEDLFLLKEYLEMEADIRDLEIFSDSDD